jgi:hypothetical protein
MGPALHGRQCFSEYRRGVGCSRRRISARSPVSACCSRAILELRRSLALPLDDILDAMRRCVNPKLSRVGIHRRLQRHGLSARLTPRQAPDVTFHTDAPAGFIHIDVKYLPPLGAGAATPISRSTVPPALSTSKSSPIAGSPPPPVFWRFLDRFPLEVHS